MTTKLALLVVVAVVAASTTKAVHKQRNSESVGNKGLNTASKGIELHRIILFFRTILD